MKKKWEKVFDKTELLGYQWEIKKLHWAFFVEQGRDKNWRCMLAVTDTCDFVPCDGRVWATSEKAMKHCEQWFNRFLAKAHKLYVADEHQT